MRRPGLAAALLALAAPALAQSDAWLPRQTGEIQVLDKVNARATNLTMQVGQQVESGTLTITLRRCAVRPPDVPQESAAFLDIKDSRPGAPGFHGWMFAGAPAVAMLEHPIYDVHVVGCR